MTTVYGGGWQTKQKTGGGEAIGGERDQAQEREGGGSRVKYHKVGGQGDQGNY